ncbi:tandem-95 repeat protein, partial [Psychrobacter sanguinis]|uniref:tandem-95 repeat protein n=1 Tax=Psychrobacter sanguinis TaxID=861445 RepID=UPI002A75C4E8
EDTVATGKLSPATDVDGDKLTYALADKAANGTVTISADGSYKYTPKANFNGSDSFTYTITDGTETITQTATITVDAVNDLPVSKDSVIQAVEDTVATGKLSAATDADGDKLTYALADKAANGTAVVNADGNYSYTPNKDFFGTDSFTYTISDGKSGVITQKASVTVQGVNDAPVSTNTAIKVVEDTVATGKLSPATDVDGDKLTYALADKAANGTVTISADGSYKYTPNANFNGSDSFTYTITDGTDTITQTATVTVYGISQVYNNELQEVFEKSIISEEQVLVNEQSFGSMYREITFEVTGDNAIAIFGVYDPSASINLDGYYQLTGPSSSTSGSLSILSAGSTSYSEVLGSNLAPGKYTLYVDAYEYGSTINLDVLQYQDVERTEFTGYENVSGNIFADANITAPKNYILQVGGQSLANSEVDPIVIKTTKGTFKLSSDGSYNYLSKGSELGLDPKKLSEAFNIIVSDTKGNYLGVYRVEVEPDTTPPVPGKLALNNFEDTGTSQDDNITQGNTFDLAVQGNEAGSAVEFEYSSDNGKTWSTIFNGAVSNLEDGEYSFRAKVTDEALNQSLTEVKTITIDNTAPVLDQILNFSTTTNTLEIDANIDKATVKTYELSNGSQTELESVTSIPFKEGGYRIEASDVAGNTTALEFNMAVANGDFHGIEDTVNIVVGGPDSDTIYGSNANDILVTNGKSDNLYGMVGNDTLIIGSNSFGTHYLNGGQGDDKYIISKENLNFQVKISDSYGFNTLDLIDYNLSDVLDWERQGHNLTIYLEQGSIDISYQFNENENSTEGVDYIKFNNGEVLNRTDIAGKTGGIWFGTSQDDVFTANTENSILHGLEGNDNLTGGSGNDNIYGGVGDDTLISAYGNDRLYGGKGNDMLILGEQPQRVFMDGDYGNDTYVIHTNKLSAGVNAIIYDFHDSDSLEIQGILPSDLFVSRKNDNIDLSTKNGGIITLAYQLLDDERNVGVDNIYFDNGDIWTRADLESMISGIII